MVLVNKSLIDTILTLKRDIGCTAHLDSTGTWYGCPPHGWQPATSSAWTPSGSLGTVLYVVHPQDPELSYILLHILQVFGQVRKLFFVAPKRKLRSSKAQLRSLHFKILDANFMTGFLLWNQFVIALIVWWLSPALGKLRTRVRILRNFIFIKLRLILFNKFAVAFFAL